MGLSALFFACVLLFAEGQGSALGAGEVLTGEGVLPMVLSTEGSPTGAAGKEGASTGPALARRQLAARRGATSGAVPVKGASTVEGAAPVKGAASTVKGAVHPKDAATLLKAAAKWKLTATDNRNLLGTWDLKRPCSQWFGVTCDTTTQRVTAIKLPRLGSDDQPFFVLRLLPAELGSLPELRSLILARNYMESPPKEWARLGKLSHLDMSIDSTLNLNRPVVYLDVVWNLTSLTYLNLANIYVSGSNRHDFYKLPRLVWLDLSGGFYLGTIKPLLGLTGLKSLFLRSCLFSSADVQDMGLLTGLQQLDLSGNYFSKGGVLTWLGDLQLLTSLDLSGSHLVGTIPSQVEFLLDLKVPKLARLSLGDNGLNGTLPKTMLNSPRLTYLDLSGNNLTLTGVSFGAHASSTLQALDLSRNRINGSIPKGISGLTRLSSLSLSGTHLSGTLPKFLWAFPSLGALDLSNNSLTGRIPDAATSLTSLTSLTLSHNKLTGSIPFGTWFLSNLMVNDNLLSGNLPYSALFHFADIFKAGSAGLSSDTVDVSGNYFTGPCYSTEGAANIKCDKKNGTCTPPLSEALNGLLGNCLQGCANKFLTPKQRSSAQCAKFCGADEMNGPCNGHGTCSLKGPKKTPACTCDKGYVVPPSDLGACFRKRTL